MLPEFTEFRRIGSRLGGVQPALVLSQNQVLF